MDIIHLYGSGLKFVDIAKQVKTTPRSVSKVIEKYRKEGTIDRRPGQGRKRKTTKVTDRHIQRQVKLNPTITSREIQETLSAVNIKICKQTIRNRIYESGLCGRKARKVPLISEKNARKRLAFAKKYKDMPESFWQKIIFSDESSFKLYSNRRTKYVWRKSGDQFKPGLTKPTVKYSKSIMVWGCFSYSSLGSLVVIEGIMNAVKYKDINDNHLFKSATKMNIQDNFIFQQDNDPKHTSKLLKNYFTLKDIELLDHPPQSPDLNPIENLWDEIDRNIKLSDRQNINAFESALFAQWNNVSSTTIAKLIKSMPERLQAVIDSKGYATRF